jgi:hypothetical protein
MQQIGKMSHGETSILGVGRGGVKLGRKFGRRFVGGGITDEGDESGTECRTYGADYFSLP